MPTVSLLLPLLVRLLRLALLLRDLLPVLLHLPPMAARLSPRDLPLPRFVSRLPTFALRPLAFLAARLNHARSRHHPAQHPPATLLHPVAAAPARIRPSCPNAPQTAPKSTPPCHPSYPRTRVSTPTSRAPQTQQKCAPRPPKSFLEKTLNAREVPKLSRFSRSRQQPSTGSVRRLLRPRWAGTGCPVEAAEPQPSADPPWRLAVNQGFPRPELDRRAVEAAQPRPLAAPRGG